MALNAERISVFLVRCMLGLFLALMALGLALGALQTAQQTQAFLCGLLAAAALLFLLPRAAAAVAQAGTGRALLALCLACLLVKGAWILLVRPEPAGDYMVFWQCANALTLPETLFNGRYVALFPHIYGYSHFLSLFIRLFGPGELLAQILNVGLSVLSGCLLFALAYRWIGLEAGISAFLLWILCPSQTVYNSFVLSEPYYTALLLVFLALVTQLYHAGPEDRRQPLWGLAAGGLAGLVLRALNGARPIAAVPIIALAIWAVCLRRPRGGRGWRLWLPFLAALMAVYLAAGPLWNAAVERAAGEPPASVPGFNLLVGLNRESAGMWNESDSQRLAFYSGQPGATAQSAQEALLREAADRAAADPGAIPGLLLDKLRVFLGSDHACVLYAETVLRHRDLFTFICNTFYYAAVLLSLAGAAVLFRTGERSAALLLPLYALGLTLAQLLVEVAPRYHYSLIPMFLLTAQYALFGRRGGREAP